MPSSGSILLTLFVVMLGIAVFGICYFAVFGVVFNLANFASSLPGMPAEGQVTINIYVNAFLWSGIIFIIGMIGYFLVYARRKEYDVTSGY